MAIYTDIIKTLGQDLVDYNVSGWALFRDQMALEISSQYVLGNERKPDESLLAYSRGSIEQGLKSVKDGTNNFTYYTSSGPQSKIDDSIGGAQLADPQRKLKTSDTKIEVNAGNYRDANGKIIEEYYAEGSVKYLENLMRPKEKPLTLLDKTTKWFAASGADYLSGKFTTLISRFHTDKNQLPISELQKSVGLQGFSTQYGLSRGNSVLKADAKKGEKGDDYNPYCRVWTWHQAYKKYKDTMRPFSVSGTALEKDYNWKVFRSNNNLLKNEERTKLREYGVMYDNNGNTNGLVNITPSTKDGETNFDVSVKKCMFSIENLAWKGTYNSWNTSESNGLSQEQKGPLGGRIMWFPPYDLKFNETTTANWQTNDFIGRGEPIFTYANTVRSGTLSFKLLIDHPAILDYWERRDEISETDSGIDDVKSKEQELLRFFAGCSVLTAKGPKEEKAEEESKVETDPAPTPVGPRLVFDVYFPNNYSGVNDKNTKVNPIDYLINGVATNRGRVSTSNDGKIEDISTDITTIWKRENGQQVGGYEIRGEGISLVYKVPQTEVITTVTSGDDNSYMLIAIKNKRGESKYCYRVDNGLNENLLFNDSYVNIVSSSLNSKTIPTDLKDNDATTVTFTDFYVALNPEAEAVLKGYFNKNNVAICKKILEESKITNIQCFGEASYQGKEKNNQGLAKHRAETIRDWLVAQKIKFSGQIGTPSRPNTSANRPINGQDADEYAARIQRKVRVTIYYEDSSTEDASETQISVPESGTSGTTSAVIVNNGEQGTDVQGKTPPEQPVDIPNNNIALGRYDNEARFFKQLTQEDPFVTRLIRERIKNFDPVFHSMSPEGFNARLTFLNQCLRQGPTLSSIDSEYANNLAFGVPPVCVLRVGDFYNTKIIITNLNINYDPLSWDLNEEGIGVMPMIANIDISFNFIGGSDLGGPIQRLQNATSFNYYANASVYDNRAEEIIYENGKFTAFKAFEPNMYKE